MKILVTGATGFIGSHIARVLIEQGHEVLATGSCPERAPKGARFLPHNLNGIDFRQTEGIQAVIHQAASNDTLSLDYEQMIRSNFYAACDLFLAILHNSDCTQFIYASSTAVYGNQPTPWIETQQPGPLTPYARSKLRFDDYAVEFAKRYNVNVVGLRYCNVYGPGEEHKGARASMISQMAERMKKGLPLNLFKDGSQRREWIYVKDVVRANLLALGFKGSEVFNCSTGKPYAFNEVVDVLNEHLGKKYCEKCGDIFYVDNVHEDIYQSNVHTDTTKAETMLGFRTEFDLMDGIKDYL